jgi:ribosomal protein S18 acetylase RimI-like enzyme
VALRPLRAGACEVKRLYVPARFRGHGLGRKLLQAAIADARQTGYSEMYCDTLPDMQEAAKLYDSSGFTRVEPYSDRPTPGAIYFRLVLGHGAA